MLNMLYYVMVFSGLFCVLCSVLLCVAISPNDMLCCEMLWYVMSGYVMVCDVVLSRVLL